MSCIELSYYMTCKNMITMVCLYFNAIKRRVFIPKCLYLVAFHVKQNFHMSTSSRFEMCLC